MIKTITIPLNPNDSYEFPTRICLVCEKLEREGAKVVSTSGAWLCDRCRNTLLELIKDFNATSNAPNALNALEQENKENKHDD